MSWRYHGPSLPLKGRGARRYLYSRMKGPLLRSLHPSLDPSLERDVLLERIVKDACKLTKARRGCLFLYNPRIGELKLGTMVGNGPGMPPFFEKVALEVISQGEGRLSSLDGRPPRRSLIAVPLTIKGQPFGVICVAERRDGKAFSPWDLLRLEGFSLWACLCVENNALYDTVYRNIMDTFQSLVMTLEAKDPYTKEHSQRATQIALDIAEVMGATEAERESLRLAGWLHDIGKIGIQDSILSKPGPLTPEEYEVIKAHPLIGEKILEPLGLLPIERKIIRNHHERWDGRGYPDGLNGPEIPALVRIFTVADAFEAMTSTRPYRRAKTLEESLEELDALSWLQFDGEVVKALKEVLRRKRWQEREGTL